MGPRRIANSWRRLLGDPRMMCHLGGPESPEKLDERPGTLREARLAPVQDPGRRRSMRIRSATGRGSGQRQDLWEVGWAVVPEFQGRGIATRGHALADRGDPLRSRSVGRDTCLPVGRQRGFQRGVQEGGLSSLGRIRFRVPTRSSAALQRLGARSSRRGLADRLRVELESQRDGRTVACPIGKP